MKDILKCIIISLVSSAFSYPVSQPVYQNPQYVSAQSIYKQQQPQALGYAQQQYVRPQVAPGFESRVRAEGLQNYATPQIQTQPIIPDVLLATNINKQLQKAPQYSSPNYLSQSAQLATQAQEAFASAQRKAASQGSVQPTAVAQPQQYSKAAQQYSTQPQQYSQSYPQQQYLREQSQPQVRYVSKPATTRYKVPQQSRAGEEEAEKDDYDPNPSYQFGFDVKDDLYTNYQNRKEQREGNKITGSYSVVDSDGYIRTVQYTADPKEGFKAEVSRQPTDIVVKIPKRDPQFQSSRPHIRYVQQAPQQQRGYQQEERQQQQPNTAYQYQ